MRLNFPLIIFALLLATNLLSQEDQQLIRDIIEETAGKLDEEVDFTILTERLHEMLDQPIDINNASTEDLQELFFLNDFQIFSLREYMKNYGAMLSVYELQFVHGFDKETISRVIPFISLGNPGGIEPASLGEYLRTTRHQLFLRTSKVLEPQKGFQSSDDLTGKTQYPGLPYKFYTRYRMNDREKISLGFTLENDPGEDLLSGSNKYGPDFYSGYFQLNNLGPARKLITGDYQLMFGQGVTLWSAASYGKSPMTAGIQKYGRGIYKYSSSNENNFFRGVATELDFKDFRLTLFYSGKKVDATIAPTDSSMQGPREFTALQNSGYHRTRSEIQGEDALHEQVVGGNITFRKSRYKLGVTAFRVRFDGVLQPSDQLYKRFHFTGNETYNLGTDYMFYLGKASFFGEAGYSSNQKGIGMIHGVQLDLGNNVYFTLSYRHYSKAYTSLYGNSLSENSANQNESAIYSGIEVRAFQKWKFSGYFDHYSFPWLRYQASSPSNGYEGFVQADFLAGTLVDMYLRLKHEVKAYDDQQAESITPRLTERQTSRIRYHVNYAISERLRLRNRLEFSFFEQGETVNRGYLAYQDVIFSLFNHTTDLYMRYSLFDADDYYSRIYTYENDLLYSFNIPSFFNKGTRFYVMARISPLYNLDVWLKYGITSYTGIDKISSGLTEINGNTKSEVKLQLRVRF